MLHEIVLRFLMWLSILYVSSVAINKGLSCSCSCNNGHQSVEVLLINIVHKENPSSCINRQRFPSKWPIPGVTDDHSFKHGCFPIQIQYLTTALGRILFSSVVMVLAYQPGGPGSNPARIIYFCHAFIHFFLCYGLCS